ncbi:RNA polymerase sigma-70 factor [Siphonobacter sp. SORGH_AS_1065]|uniref:RNA polymerase sigma-70 factor n=1 Tax=Siphonobacter sp. SORGH_AS_1065 TaxID=3041795 RepID=UPI002782A80C|nr:RNA polymerase sigma-70 factor [Siphonobacter sp. SORGH_AS_1065]MDQ1090342.1 RNA polymerase sigma-70 factor (family 1) [Siphonobacter sp. SORGH_AS_1065]
MNDKKGAETLTDQQFLEAIRMGNERTFELLFRQHYSPLCQYGFSFLKDWDDAEEVVQAMFLAFWEKRDSLVITTSLKSYLYRAVHNRCLNRIKHLSVQAEYQSYVQADGSDVYQSPVQELMASELDIQLQRAIERLPEQCRLIFMMSRFEELKYQEIADQLGLSIKTVENQIGKALRILRTELADYLPLLLLLGIHVYD